MKIKIKNSYNENLYGILEKNSRSNEIIIICHGSRGNKEAGLQKYLSTELLKKYNTFRFDFAGNGESEGKLEESTYIKEIKDLRKIVQFLSKKYNIKTIIGYSKSSTQILLDEKYLGKFTDRLIAIAPRIDLLKSREIILSKKYKKEIKKYGYYKYPSNIEQKITKKFLDEIKKINNITKHYEGILNTLILHGENDTIIPIKETKKFSKRFKNIKFIKINNTDHLFMEEMSKQKILNMIERFL